MKRLIQCSGLAITAVFITVCEPTEWVAEGSCERGSPSWNCKAGGKGQSV